MSSNKKISVKLLVDPMERRVVLAESNEDFVDVLLSFLTMPMGTIIRLLGKDSTIGCISNLYQSIENLDSRHFQTKACKNMLLRPQNAAYHYIDNLTVNVDDTKPRKFFTCEEPGCRSRATCFYSSVPDVQCGCGKKLTDAWAWQKIAKEAGDGVFVKGGLKFVVSDDLHIMLASTAVLLSLLGRLGKDDGNVLEEMILDLGHDEILNLLKRTLVSTTPLTDLCFNSSPTNHKPKSSHTRSIFQLIPKSEIDEDSERCEKVEVKLLSTKNNNKVVHMEGGEDMLDLVFSFLTVPLGSVVKLLEKKSSMGCADNLYSSVESLSSEGNKCIKSEQCKAMLLSPKLAPMFGCQKKLLIVDELVSMSPSIVGCYSCFRSHSKCSHGVGTTKFKELNPKSCSNGTEPGGGYAKGSYKFIVADDLQVVPLSLISTVHTINMLEVPIKNLVEMEVCIGETEALNLLKAALASVSASEAALTNIFCANKNVKRKR